MEYIPVAVAGGQQAPILLLCDAQVEVYLGLQPGILGQYHFLHKPTKTDLADGTSSKRHVHGDPIGKLDMKRHAAVSNTYTGPVFSDLAHKPYT